MRSAKIQLSLDRSLSAEAHPWSNPVVPGDHPDPTIIEVDGVFWASATSGEWCPQFPLFRSTNLIDWTTEGSIFPVQPAWAEGSFWAPELVHDEVTGRFVVWYVGKRRGDQPSLCIAVATAPAPRGPYTDHGLLIAEPDGSIDPCFARDEHGAPFLIWKEDGNSQQRPTPIWAQPLTPDLLHLTGEKTQLITNDQPWEEGVVEGPYILRHRGWFYMFYAGNSCCGRECKYAEGVARSRHLLGPWEKNPANPIIASNDNWRCPGHGTAVSTQSSSHDQADRPGQEYFLYHAYPAGGTIYVGREAVLDEITWSTPQAQDDPGWPTINAGHGPSQPAPATIIDFVDTFDTPRLGPSWQWPVNTNPDIALQQRALTLGIPLHSPLAAQTVESAIIAVPRPAGLHYLATVILDMPPALDESLWAGLSVVGDPFNTIGLGLRGQDLILWFRRGATQGVVWQTTLPPATAVHLSARSIGQEHHLQFSYALASPDPTAGNLTWQKAGDPYDASDLPAWDRGLRLGLMLEGPCGRSATFRHFQLRAE